MAQGQLEYDFVVAPGTDPKTISPFSIQNSEFLEGHYVLTADNRVSFKMRNYDKTSHTLGVMALSYANVATTAPLDTSASGFTQGGTTLQTGLFTTTSPNEVLVAGMMVCGCISGATPGAGYTMEVNAIPAGCTGTVPAGEDHCRALTR